jgi:hypothetical protein
MTSASFHDLSADLDGLLAALDRQLSAPVLVPIAAPERWIPLAGSWPGSETSHLEQQLAASAASCSRLIDMVRSIRVVVNPEAAGAPVPGPSTDPGSLPDRSTVAPLSVPDRILKRDYNYFNSLNAALADLAKTQQKG